MTRILLACLLALTLVVSAQGHSRRPAQVKLALVLYHDANVPAAARRLRTEVEQQQMAFLSQSTFEPGYLRLLDGRRLLVPGLRYHAGRHLVEIQDSVQPDSTHFWPLGSLRGFDLGPDDLLPVPAATPNGPVAPAGPRRFRTRLVRENHRTAQREIVEILTCVDAGPLVLAWLPDPSTTPSGRPGRLLAGPGTDPTEPLRPLELTRDAVLRLCGARAVQVRAFAMTYDLHFEQATDVARMFDYFNHLAVAKD